ncbi:MAG: hypothetical protein WKF54_14170 [Nocardioidaceae bacterium]|jgi:hypothetical protein
MHSARSAPIAADRLVRAYLTAKRHVVDGGYDHEVAWQLKAAGGPVTTARFVEEAAWVVLSAGMRESVVRSVFPRIAAACGGFEPAWAAQHRAAARRACLDAFGHEAKIDAILDIAARAAVLGDDGVRAALADPEPFLRSLPYVGPVTWRHLAKNLGAPVAKADRHLVRLAAAAGRSSVDVMCEEIGGWLGEPVAVVDIVLWRWSVLHAQDCREPCDGLPHRPTGRSPQDSA